MEEKSVLLAQLFDHKTIEILKKLLLKKDIFYLRDLSRETSVSLATTFRIIQKLLGLGLVSKDHQDKFTFYRINRESQVYKEIYALVLGSTPDPIDLFKQLLKEKFVGLFQAYVTKDKDRKIFVVSEHISQTDADTIAQTVQATTSAKPNYMVITPAFFEQMQTIGLITKDKLSVL